MDLQNWIQVLIPLVGFTANVIIQITALRLVPKMGLLKSVYLGFIAGFPAIFLLEFLTQPLDFLPLLMANVIIYSALGYCYFHFINLGETARRIRLVRELYDSGGGLTRQEILERYNSRNIVQVRIGRLLRSGQIECRAGRYYIGTPVILMMTKIIIAMKLLFLGKPSEFD